ncbi:hypothetical protein CIG19_17665 [Enterobacterales bacterium CwR94]|nr:hypothetical protein CIG19_17665 [Enterobacterales bacterium CwR94]
MQILKRCFVVCALILSLSAHALTKATPLTLVARSAPSEPTVQIPADVQNWLSQHPEITVGTWMPIHPPFAVNYGLHSFEGLSADYLALLQNTYAVKINVMRYANEADALTALKAGEVDVLEGVRGEERQGLLLSNTYQPDRAVLIHQPNSHLNYNDHLSGKILYYVGDEGLRTRLHQFYPAAKLTAITDYFNGVAAVAQNADAVMWGNQITLSNINQRDYGNRLNIANSDAGGPQNLRFAALKNQAPLISAINLLLAELPYAARNEISGTWGLDSLTNRNMGAYTLDDEQRAWAQQHPVLPVFVVNRHVPLTFLDNQGNESGFSVALIESIAHKIGIKVTWKTFKNYESMYSALKKEPNALVAVADASAPPDPKVVYSRPYLITGWVLVTRKDKPETSLEEMAGKKVAVYAGSYYLPALRERYPKVIFEEHIFSYDTAISLWTTTLDGAIVPRNAANYFAETQLARHFKIASSLPLAPLRIAMASSPQNQALLAIINNALTEYTPQSLDSQLSAWQVRHAQESFNTWIRYRDIFIGITSLITLSIIFVFWRNRFLKRNLAEQRRLQLALDDARQKAESASMSKSAFLSQMSHEIRTPMNALAGLLELEHLGRSTPSQSKNNIAVAYESARSLIMLVGDILDMAKIESGTMAVKKAPLSLTNTVNNCLTLFRSAAEAKNITLRAEITVTHAYVLFDSVMFRQILSNLLSNAIKFTPEGGEVEVALYEGKSTVEGQAEYALEVCDSGIGLSAEQQRDIFEPFVQVDEAQATHKGTGLGLSICHKLSELLHGTLSIESELGEGATFIFRFFASPAAVESQQHTPDTLFAAQAKSILVVDDHAPNRLLLSQQLESAGHHCITVENAQQALVAWAEARPPFELIITDCNMPGMSGFALTRRLRALEIANQSPAVPIIGYTAMAEHSVTEQAREAGMTDCMFKPLDLRQLLSRIEGVEASAAATQPAPLDPRIIVCLDQLAQSDPDAFKSVVQTLREQNQRDIAALQQHIAAKNFPHIHNTAHSILNTAKMTNALELKEICKKMETAAHNEDITEISRLFVQCQQCIQHIETGLQSYLSTPPEAT